MKYQFLMIWGVLGITLIVPLIIFVRYNVNKKYTAPENPPRIILLTPKETLGNVITRDKQEWRILGENFCQRQPDFVLAEILPQKIPIYVYRPEEDIHISRMIINSGYWEADLVSTMVDTMKRFPDAVFIDIGANIGIYSITMAALGYRTIAVDCFSENVKRICASSHRANITEKITIIHNGLSNKRTELQLIESSEPNVGGMEVKQLPSSAAAMKNVTTVQAILLDDLLEMFPIKTAVLKMDIEKHEDEVLKGAEKFFNTVRVESVLMEFRFHTNDKSGQSIIDFLDRYGLSPDLPSHLKNSNYTKWPGDLVWTRKHSN